MKIEKYFDLEFLIEVSQDAKALQELCNEDNGFILNRPQDSNIFPEKTIVEQINSHMAIIFLFKNYQLTNEDYFKYSSFFKDCAYIMNDAKHINDISKEAVIKILLDEDKGFSSPGFFFTKDDFIKYENLINTVDLSDAKEEYLVNSYSSFSKDEVKELPLSIFSRYPVFYNSSSY